MTNKAISINQVFDQYHEQHPGNIKLVFKSSSIFSHKSPANPKTFYTIKPLIVKINDYIDSCPSFTCALRNKLNFIIKSKPSFEYWILTIDETPKTFNLDNENYQYHETKLQYIQDPAIIELIDNLYLEGQNVSPLDEF